VLIHATFQYLGQYLGQYLAGIEACDRAKKKTPRKSGVDCSITEGAAKRQAMHEGKVEAEVKAKLSD
jgi:hypothetical protein